MHAHVLLYQSMKAVDLVKRIFFHHLGANEDFFHKMKIGHCSTGSVLLYIRAHLPV